MIPKGWQERKFGDVAEFRNGLNFTTLDSGEEVKIVGVGDFKDFDILRNTKNLSSIRIKSKLRTSDIIKSGDILFVRSNGNKALIGRCLFFPLVEEKLSFSGFTIRGRVDSDVIRPAYAAHLSRSEFVKKQISRSGGGTNISNLSQKILNDLEIIFPGFEEQDKIVTILSTWDRAIEAVEAMIANTRAQKHSLMQTLLTGKKRLPGFSGKWRKVSIGEVSREVSERGLNHADFPVLSCSKYDGMVQSLTYFKKKVYSDDTSNYKIMRRGTFGFPSNHVEEGSIGYQDICDVGIVSPIYCVFRATDAIEDGFLYKLLKTDRYRQVFAAATNASVDRRGSLRWREFAKIKVSLPPLDEQNAINDLIDEAEFCERGLSDQLTALRLEKSALMQQLLTGKRRVKLDRKEAA